MQLNCELKFLYFKSTNERYNKLNMQMPLCFLYGMRFIFLYIDS